MSQFANVATKTQINPELCKVSLADSKDSKKIAQAYENALGTKGVGGPGHEPYPDPDLFTPEGIKETIESGERKIIVIKHDDDVLGAIVADTIHDYGFEFNSMAIDRSFRGLKLGSKLLSGAKKIMDDCFFINNVTELVTHSLASQSAHIKEGYNNFLGFGYCHFPNVFFKDKPESVLWAGQLQGELVGKLAQLQKSNQSSWGKSEEEKNISHALLEDRNIYLPAHYQELGEEIVSQYSPEVNYEIKTSTESSDTKTNDSTVNVSLMPDYAHSYIHFEEGFDLEKNLQYVANTINEIKRMKGKRFIRATISANQPQAIAIANLLKEEYQFIFHSILPLYGYNAKEGRFEDYLSLQWVRKDVVQSNPLPGHTDSVIKIYGYPLNLPGKIIKQVEKDLQYLYQKD